MLVSLESVCDDEFDILLVSVYFDIGSVVVVVGVVESEVDFDCLMDDIFEVIDLFDI